MLQSIHHALHRVRRNAKIRTRATYLSIRKQVVREPLRVNIGGGQSFHPGWRTLDFAPDVRGYSKAFIDYPHDLCVGPLPFRDGEVDLFYSSHTLEHLPPWRLAFVLSEMRRCGKRARIVVPDFAVAAKAFREGDTDFFERRQSRNGRAYPTDRRIQAMTGRKRLVYQLVYYFAGHCIDQPDLDPDQFPSLEAFADYVLTLLPRDAGGPSGNFGYHANWFTAEKLTRLLHEARFSRVEVNAPGESIFPELRVAPRRHLWLSPLPFDTSYPHISICADAER